MPEEQAQPPQHQDRQPGLQSDTTPGAKVIRRDPRGSGTGRSVAAHFAKEGAEVVNG